MCRRRARNAADFCQRSGTGDVECDFTRWIHTNPVIKRIVRIVTPVIQMISSSGSQFGACRGAGAAATIRRSSFTTLEDCGALATGAGIAASLGAKRTAMSPDVDGATIVRHVCIAVTSGIVSISDSPIVATT
jgi:hypothetical protein